MKNKSLIKALMFGLCLSAAVPAGAQDGTTEMKRADFLIVVGTTGESTKFMLKDKPVIKTTVAGDSVNVVSSLANITFAIKEVAYYNVANLTYEAGTPTGIGSVKEGAAPQLAEGKAFFSGLKAGMQVAVYTADGKKVASVAATADGVATVDLSGLKPGGVYILRSPSASFKIIK